MLNSVWSFVGWGVSLKILVLESVSSLGRWGFSFTRPVIESLFVRTGVGEGEGLSYTPLNRICLAVRRMASLSYRLRVRIRLVSHRVVSLSNTPYAALYFVIRWVDTILHTSCWNLSRRSAGGSFSNTHSAGIRLVIRRVGSLSFTPHAEIYLVV